MALRTEQLFPSFHRHGLEMALPLNRCVAGHEFQVITVANLIRWNKCATRNPLKNHYAPAILLQEPLQFRVVGITSNKFDLCGFPVVEHAVALPYLFAGLASENHEDSRLTPLASAQRCE